MKTVNIGENVKTIPKYAFFNCTGLTEITIPDSVTRIVDYAFYGCTRLTSVTIGSGVTSIGSSAFYDCTGLTDVYITDPNAWCKITFGDSYENPMLYGDALHILDKNGQEVTEIVLDDTVESIPDSRFKKCVNLTKIIIPDSVTSIGSYAFGDCTGLTSVTIGSGVTSIGNLAFYNCTGLTSVTIGSGVTSIGDDVFSGCSSLTSITIPDSVTSIGDRAFEYCTGLIIVNFNAANCTSMGSYSYPAFEGCTNLKTVNVGENVKTIPAYAFQDCTGLESVTIGSGVTSIGSGAFYGCTGLTDVYITDPNAWCKIAFANYGANPMYYGDALHILDKNGQEVTEIVLDDTVESIPDSRFEKCVNLTKIIIPDSVASIGGSAFDGCIGLTEITIPDSVTSIGNGAFRGCTALTDVDYDGTYMDKADITIHSGNDCLKNATWQYTLCQEDSHYFTKNGNHTCDACGYSKKPNAPVVESKNHNSVTLIATEGFEYSKDGVNWQRSNVFADLQIDTNYTFYQRVKASDTSLVGEISGGTIVLIESPVQSLSINDITLMEGNGPDYADGYYYSLADCEPKIVGTVTLKDGTVHLVSNSFHIELDGEVCYIETDLSIQHEEPWLPGHTYTLTATLLGVTDTFNVTIIPSPVESVTFEDVILYETDNWYDLIDDCVLSEVRLKDGTTATIVGNNGIVYNGKTYYTTDNYDDLDQWNWQVGEQHTVTGTILGVSGTFTVTVAEKPIQGLEILKMPDKTEYLAGERINLKGAILRLRYTDSTFEDFAIDHDCSGYFKRVYSEKLKMTTDVRTDYDNSTTGQQLASVSLFGATCTMPINVIENLVQSISIREDADKSIVITVYNTDGTNYDMRILGVGTASILTDKGEFGGHFIEEGSSYAVELYLDGGFSNEKMLKSNSLSPCRWIDFSKMFANGAEMSCLINYFEYGERLYTGTVTAENIDILVAFALGMADHYIFDGETMRAAFKEKFGIDNVDLTLSEYYDPLSDQYYFEHPLGGGVTPLQRPNRISFSDGLWIVDCSYWHQKLQVKFDEEGRIIEFNLTEPQVCSDVKYTVTFVNEDGTDLSKKTYRYGDTVIAPANPMKEADNTYTYTFVGWDKEIVNCAGNATYRAVFEKSYIDYTIIFQDEDSTEISRKTYHWGDTVTAPSNPTKPADNTCSYTFAGWDKSVDSTCAGNAIYIATYTATHIDYIVGFVNEDGTPISLKPYHWGDTVTAPGNPTKPADNTYTYTFKGWDKEVVNCAGNAIYTATYEKTYIIYEVSFKNWNGDVLANATYHWGDAVTAPNNPTKPADNTYTYTFKGWDKEVVNCAGTTTYTAVFEKAFIDYTVIFRYADGTVIAEKTYHYGDKVTIPADPVAPEGFQFTGWDKEITDCQGNATYTATFEKAYIPGDVDGNETVTDADAVYLLYYTFLPDAYPVNQDCDFNGDGVVTDQDAVYLLYYTFLPDQYPIS